MVMLWQHPLGSVLPVAVAAYQEGLPARYSLDYHSRKVGPATGTLAIEQ